MNAKTKVEFRYYDIPQGDLVLPLTGETWNKEYGEGKEKLHFHNYYEVGRCYAGEGEMILGETEYPFYPGCVSLIPTKELHTTNTFGKTAGWEWLYFDIHDVLKKMLLALSGYVGGAAGQTASTINMLHIMYLWMPMVFNLLITLILTRLNVEKANEELRKHK